MTDYIVISRDPFARHSLVRHVARGSNKRCCDWCGSPRRHGDDHAEHPLFIYGTLPDDRYAVNWHKGHFCSKSCHDSYHS